MMRTGLVALFGGSNMVKGALLFALMMFFVFFLATLGWVFRRKSGEVYSRLSKLPLEKEYQ